MNFLNFLKKSRILFASLILIIFSLFSSEYIFADYMQSSTYKMQSDSLNFGGIDSSSTEYNLSDSLGEVATGESNSSNYYLHAGFWQMQESFISVSSPSDLAMNSMGGLSGGSSEGTVSWLVTTDNTAGYQMTINSSTTPALKSSEDSLADYSPATADPDYSFTNIISDSSFGFSPEGDEISDRFKDNGSICNSGTLDTASRCWDGLSTTPKIIAGSTSSNMPAGGNTTVRFRAESGAEHIQTSGDYTAVVTVTAITL